MEAKAVQKYILTSPQKLREVVYIIKKFRPVDAIERLPFTYKRAALPLEKVIKTAIANARQKGANEADLIFKEIQINEGPRLRRFRAGARGRAKPYKKRMSHIRVVVMTESPKAQPVKKDEEVRVVEAETPKEVKVAKEKVVKAKTVKAPKKGAKKASA